MKNLISILIICLLSNCEASKEKEYYKIAGYTQGTTYHITYQPSFKNQSSEIIIKKVDSLLSVIDTSMSTYINESLISSFNKNKYIELDEHFENVFNQSKKINHLTNGSFNPAFGYIFNYYGFGENKKPVIDKIINLDSIIPMLDFNLIEYDSLNSSIKTKSDLISLNFNAIAQGYSVDEIAQLFDQLKIENYFIEVGGELKVKGVNPKNKYWKVGIETPIESLTPNNESIALINLNSKSLATSGSYRKFNEINGKKFSHTINPITGKPITHHLLSTTVISSNCALSDALATTFMIWGEQKTKDFLHKNAKMNLQVYLISYDSINNNYKEFVSDNLIDYFQKN